MPVPKLTPAHQGAASTTGGAPVMQPPAPRELSSRAIMIAKRNEPFFLRHHPDCWEVSTTLETPTLLPQLGLFVIAPGVSGVRTRSKTEVNHPEKAYEQAVAIAREREGWVFLDPHREIPADCLPPGVPPGGYLREADCEDPQVPGAFGTHYEEAWAVPLPTAKNRPQRFRYDKAAHERWRLWLVESGQIDPPTDAVIEELKARAVAHVDNARRPKVNEIIQAEALERATAQLDALNAVAFPVPESARDAERKDAELAELRARLAAIEADKAEPAESTTSKRGRR
jgi:hypothetical protein